MRFQLTILAAVLLTAPLLRAQVAVSEAAKPAGAQSIPVEAEHANYRTALVSLSEPAKLATLGNRGANPRLKKIVYWLVYARLAGADPGQVIDEIVQQNGYGAKHAALIKTNLLRNIKIGDELGFFTPDNLYLLRHGDAPRVMRGPYAGDRGEVDHIIPFSVAPEIGNDLSNLELMPGILNRKKSAKVGQRQKALARDLKVAGVIDDAVLSRILNTSTVSGPSLDATSGGANGGYESPVAASITQAPAISASAQSVSAAAPVIVWVNTATGIYHMPGTKWYGRTQEGQYMREEEAVKTGNRKAGNGQ